MRWFAMSLWAAVFLVSIAGGTAWGVDNGSRMSTTAYTCTDDGNKRTCSCKNFIDCNLMKKQVCDQDGYWGCTNGTFKCSCKWKAARPSRVRPRVPMGALEQAPKPGRRPAQKGELR